MSKRSKFAKFYDKYVDKIYRYIFFKVDSTETTEDLTSEVFLRAWQAFQNEEIKDIRAFLYQTARNLLVDYYRKKAKTKTVSFENASFLVNFDPELPEKIERKFQLDLVKNRLKNLREEYQEAIFLRYIEGYSIKEIAEILNKTPENTKVLIHRALEALKRECNLSSKTSSS